MKFETTRPEQYFSEGGGGFLNLLVRAYLILDGGDHHTGIGARMYRAVCIMAFRY